MIARYIYVNELINTGKINQVVQKVLAQVAESGFNRIKFVI